MDSNIPTPALVVDLDKLENNTKRMLDKVKKHNIKIRPHIKTHKTIEGALYQLFGKKDIEDDQSYGITVSTLGEAEFFASSGKFTDILYAVPLSPNKFQKAFEISNKIKKFSVFVDNESVAHQLIQFAKDKAFQWHVWLKVDAGYNRAGVKPFEPISLVLAKLLSSTAQIHFMGIYSHSGDSYNSHNAEEILMAAEKERKVMSSFAQLLRNEGIMVENVAIGSTPSCSVQENFEGITEIHPGNYIFYDRFQASIGACTLENIACSVLTSVLAHYPAKNRFMIDAGALALSKDTGPTEGKDWGHIVGHPNLVICSLSQEVGLVETRDGSPLNFDLFPIGSTINILPNHSCLTAALYPKYYVQKQGKTVDIWATCPRSW